LEENGDKVGLIVLNDFGHSGLNTISLFVIPAKAGTQIQDVPGESVSRSPSFWA
jgi:hypothetical protein